MSPSQKVSTRCIIALVMALTSTMFVGASPAAADTADELVQVTQLVPLQTLRVTTSALAQDPLLPFKSCDLTLRASFSGVKNTSTGQITGQWEQVAGTDCQGIPNGNMEMLIVTGDMRQNGVLQFRLAGGFCEGGAINPSSCDFEVTAGTFTCGVCNGNWTFESTHLMDLPTPFTWGTTPRDSRCEIDELDNSIMACDVRASAFLS